ncbi:hypothetical protein GWK47_036407 [Chionoecetes opilio]|uniref:Uncharacterized protein n=1 Tax=Chionoecetes opilio TaxID=41210 RepID=A0A8J4YEF8_CHIOP|nr:hypothetical protein GWK47_036407 [Chionoecetes opilio]
MVNILGVEVNALSFTSHVRKTASKAAGRLNCVRRVSHLLDARGVTTLYAAQVRSLMEYAPLTWSSCPPPVPWSPRQGTKPCPAAHLPEGSPKPAARPPTVPTAQARRGRPVRHVQNPQAGRPAPRYTPAAVATPHPYSTRDAHKRDQQLSVPFARTETFFRSFLPRYSRLWNRVVRQTDMHQAATLHIFKCAVNAWLMPSRHN